MAGSHLGIDFSNPATAIALLAAVPIVLYLIGPLILNLLTPKPLPGIPYRKGRQYPIIGDGLDAGKWLAAQTTITQWFDGCTKAFIYGGKELGSEWGVLDGKKSAADLLAVFEKPDLKRSEEYEGISQLMFGFGNGARQVIITDVEEILQVLTKRTTEFDRADVTINVFRGILPLGQISLKTDSMWKHHRRALGPTMTSKNLKMFHPRAITAANNLIKLWNMKAAELKGEEFFESSDDLMYFAMDAISDIAFGKSFELLPEYIGDFRKSTPSATAPPQEVDFPFQPNAMFRATEYLLNTLPLFSAFPKVSTFIQEFQPTFRKNRALVHNFIYEQIRQGRARAAQRGDDKVELADCAIDMALLKDGTPDELANDPLRDEVFQYAVAGMETTARTLAWGMKLLSRSPQVQERLRKELMDAGLHEREMSFDDLAADHVPYLEATSHEILRLAGTAAGVSRIATRDTIVLGKSIPKGTTLYLPLALIATMPLEDIAATPTSESAIHPEWKGNTLMQFKPERWLNEEGQFDSQVGSQSAPFSGGQRGCFGKALAMLELKTMLAKISLAFFLDRIPAEYDSDVFVEYISRKPKSAFIRPIPWKATNMADPLGGQ